MMLYDSKPETNSKTADGQMLCKGCKRTEKEVEGVLEQDGKMGNRARRGEVGGEAFDIGPGEVDVKQ